MSQFIGKDRRRDVRIMRHLSEDDRFNDVGVMGIRALTALSTYPRYLCLAARIRSLGA